MLACYLQCYSNELQQREGGLVAKLGVIADDITGANDTAVQFAKHNISSFVCIDFNKTVLGEEIADVVVVDTDSRDIAPDEAYQKVTAVCQAFKDSGVKNIYKKVDSTLRGNLGAEIEAAAKVFEPELVVIAPAFPANNRITVGGYHLLNQIPIELTEIAHAPKSPVTESRVVELLRQQTKEQIGFIGLNDIISGEQAVREAIDSCLKKGKRWIVFDAAQDEHLALIAKAAHSYKVLWAGSAGLAEQLRGFFKWTHKDAEKEASARGSVLVVAGSVSKITQQQVRSVLNLQNTQLIKISGKNLIEHNTSEIQRCINEFQAMLSSGKDVLLASAVADEDVLQAVTAGKVLGMSSVEVSEQTAAALGEVVRGIGDYALSGMVLTGGDTAIHVCRALGAEAIKITKEITTGIPLGRLVGGKLSGLQVVTKAGAFGCEDALVLAIQAIRPEKEEGGKK